MQLNYSALMILTLVATFGLSGCGTTVPVKSAGNEADLVSQLVVARAQARWDALRKRDMDSAYQFISPAGRSLMSVEAYRPRVNAQFWRGATAKEAVCAAETCEVTVMVDMQLEGVKFTTPVKETWILDAGKWWFVYQG